MKSDQTALERSSTDTAAVLEQPSPPFKEQHLPEPGLQAHLDPAPK